MRRLVPIVVAALGLVPSVGAAVPAPAAAPEPASWAQPQIAAVLESGLFPQPVDAFQPQRPLTQRALADALEALALTSEDGAPARYRARAPDRAVTIRELDAALVAHLGLGDAARAVAAALRGAGLGPRPGAGTETVARMLGLRTNHPAARDELELALSDPATRAEAAYSLAKLRELSPWHVERVRASARGMALPELTEPQRAVLRRAVSFVGTPYVWGGTSEKPQKLWDGRRLPGGFDCSGFVWRVFKLEPFPGASALATVLRGRTTFELSGEVPPAQRVRNVDELQPGDLIFQGAQGPRSKPAQVDHAGIYLGGDWLVHSSRHGTTLHPFEGWYRERFAWARRPLREAGLS
jgi:cell wall-associated NlpC family hydrolase